MKVSIFDFDGTLVNLPYKEEDSYMDTVESVECISEMNESVVNDYFEHENDFLILLTNRTVELESVVTEFLVEHDIYFDMSLFRIDNHKKSKRIEFFIEENLDSIESIEYWDDKEIHIKDLQNLFEKYSLNYKLHLVK